MLKRIDNTPTMAEVIELRRTDCPARTCTRRRGDGIGETQCSEGTRSNFKGTIVQFSGI